MAAEHQGHHPAQPRVHPIDDVIIAQQQGAADIFHDIGAIPARIDIRAAAWRGWS